MGRRKRAFWPFVSDDLANLTEIDETDEQRLGLVDQYALARIQSRTAFEIKPIAASNKKAGPNVIKSFSRVLIEYSLGCDCRHSIIDFARSGRVLAAPWRPKQKGR